MLVMLGNNGYSLADRERGGGCESADLAR